MINEFTTCKLHKIGVLLSSNISQSEKLHTKNLNNVLTLHNTDLFPPITQFILPGFILQNRMTEINGVTLYPPGTALRHGPRFQSPTRPLSREFLRA